jgi:Cu2+-exporting ATPase
MAPAAHEGTHAAHTDHGGHEELFRRRFWVCLALTVPVLLYSHMLQMWLGFSAPAFPGSIWVGPLFAVIIFLYGGLPFFGMAVPELKNREPGMMTLISLAIGVAFVYSIVITFIDPASGFFWEMALLIDVMLLGHWLEMRSVRQASGALGELAKLMPDTADRVGGGDGTGDIIETVPAADLRAGDIVLVRPGASVPADGVVVSGESDVSEAMLTGESKPVKKGPEARVIGGTVNGSGSLRVRVEAIGEQTALAGIMRLVAEAQASKSRTQLLADRAARLLFYVALAAAAVTLIVWSLIDGLTLTTVERVVTVLVIACPHALGLAVPLVVAISTSLAARNGILVRDRLALEEARHITTVLFDKTGTLTTGQQGVVGVVSEPPGREEAVLALAAAAEGDSEHIIARAIRTAAQAKDLALPEVSGFRAIQGRGLSVKAQGEDVYVGGPRLLEMLSLTPPPALQQFADKAGAAGQSVIYLVQGGRAAGAFAVADQVRPESQEAVTALRDMDVDVAMLTGDSKDVARDVAQELGIQTYFAEVLPEHKDTTVAQLQQQGQVVGMVGDGVNDAPALTRADVGLAIGAGTDVAIESAGIVLASSDPRSVVKTIRLSRATYRKMIQNLWWAAGYNIVAIPLAMGLLAPWGVNLSPAMGAALMAISTIVVALNAQLLRRVDLMPDTAPMPIRVHAQAAA